MVEDETIYKVGVTEDVDDDKLDAKIDKAVEDKIRPLLNKLDTISKQRRRTLPKRTPTYRGYPHMPGDYDKPPRKTPHTPYRVYYSDQTYSEHPPRTGRPSFTHVFDQDWTPPQDQHPMVYSSGVPEVVSPPEDTRDDEEQKCLDTTSRLMMTKNIVLMMLVMSL